MPGYSEVCVWLQNDKHEAMKKALAELNLKLVTLAEPKAGYLTYHMKDVSTAIYQAERAHGLQDPDCIHHWQPVQDDDPACKTQDDEN